MLGTCPHCTEAGRECLGWTEHPDTGGRVEDQEIRELCDLGAQPLIEASLAECLLDMLTSLEVKKLPESAPDKPPTIFAVELAETVKVWNAEQNILHACAVELPPTLFADEGGDDGAATALAGVAVQWCHQAAQPILAWALVCQGEMETTPDGRHPAHIAAAVDIDGRAYAVARDLRTGLVEREMKALPGWARLLRKDPTLAGGDLVAQLKADGLSEPHMVIMQLVVVTRAYMDTYGQAQS